MDHYVSTQQAPSEKHVNEAIEFMDGKVITKIERCGIYHNIPYLLLPDGFVVIFPFDVYRKFDKTVNCFLSCATSTCWLGTDKDTFHKIIVSPEELSISDMRYVARDIAVRECAVRDLIQKNFVTHPQLYPESDYFTIGSFMDHPNMPRPMRLRLGGSYSISF